MREGPAIGIAVVLTPIAPVIATAVGSGAIVDPDRRIAAGIALLGYPIALNLDHLPWLARVPRSAAQKPAPLVDRAIIGNSDRTPNRYSRGAGRVP